MTDLLDVVRAELREPSGRWPVDALLALALSTTPPLTDAGVLDELWRGAGRDRNVESRLLRHTLDHAPDHGALLGWLERRVAQGGWSGSAPSGIEQVALRHALVRHPAEGDRLVASLLVGGDERLILDQLAGLPVETIRRLPLIGERLVALALIPPGGLGDRMYLYDLWPAMTRMMPALGLGAETQRALAARLLDHPIEPNLARHVVPLLGTLPGAADVVVPWLLDHDWRVGVEGGDAVVLRLLAGVTDGTVLERVEAAIPQRRQRWLGSLGNGHWPLHAESPADDLLGAPAWERTATLARLGDETFMAIVLAHPRGDGRGWALLRARVRGASARVLGDLAGALVLDERERLPLPLRRHLRPVVAGREGELLVAVAERLGELQAAGESVDLGLSTTATARLLARPEREIRLAYTRLMAEQARRAEPPKATRSRRHQG